MDDGSANMLHGGHGDYWRKSKEVSMGDAYRTLVKAISQNDVPLRLEITAERDLVSDDAERVRLVVQSLVTFSAKAAFSWLSVDRFGTFF